MQCIKSNEFEQGRSLVKAYGSRVNILDPFYEPFEEFFANAVCLIQSDSEENHAFLNYLEKTLLRRVRRHGQLFIAVPPRLALNLACVYTTLKNYETAYVFLRHALERGAKKESIINEKDFDPIRKEERFIKLMKKHFPQV